MATLALLMCTSIFEKYCVKWKKQRDLKEKSASSSNSNYYWCDSTSLRSSEEDIWLSFSLNVLGYSTPRTLINLTGASIEDAFNSSFISNHLNHDSVENSLRGEHLLVLILDISTFLWELASASGNMWTLKPQKAPCNMPRTENDMYPIRWANTSVEGKKRISIEIKLGAQGCCLS